MVYVIPIENLFARFKNGTRKKLHHIDESQFCKQRNVQNNLKMFIIEIVSTRIIKHENNLSAVKKQNKGISDKMNI